MKLQLRKSMDVSDPTSSDNITEQLNAPNVAQQAYFTPEESVTNLESDLDLEMLGEHEKMSTPPQMRHQRLLDQQQNLIDLSNDLGNAQFSPTQSCKTSGSRETTRSCAVSSSISSTFSSRSEVNSSTEVILRALHAKKKGNKDQFYAEFKNQAFLKGSSSERNLRLWIKAFLECMPRIVGEFEDTELVELLLFGLPWLCHGKRPQATPIGSSGPGDLPWPSSGPASGSVGVSQLKRLFCFGPSSVHGLQFHKLYPKLCIAVFPQQVKYVHRVIAYLFSHLGIFSCGNAACFGNWQQKNQPGISPVTVQQIFQQRAADQETPDQSQNLTRNQSQQALETLQQKAKQILKKGIITAENRSFLQALFSFHQTRGAEFSHPVAITIGQANGQAAFLVNNDAISIKKCLVGLQATYLGACSDFVDAYLEDTQALKIVSVLVSIAKEFPFCQQEICKNFLKTFPHHAANFDVVLIFQKLAFAFCEKLMRARVKQSASLVSSQSQGSISGAFRNASRKQVPLQRMHEFEHQLIGKVVEKIAALDSEIKIRGRKGATFPSKNRNHQMQTQADYLKEANLRLLSEKEIKLNLFLTELLNYFDLRFRHFDSMQGQQDANLYFAEPLLQTFLELILAQPKSNFVQFLALYVIGQVNNRSISTAARNTAKLFLEKVLSELIRKAFPQGAGMQQGGDPDSRMVALNYLSSLLAQEVAPIPDGIFIKCLRLLLEFNANKKPVAEQADQKGAQSSQLFLHCLAGNLALILAARPITIKEMDPNLFQKVVSFLFHKKWPSLEYASPAVLDQLCSSLQRAPLELGVKRTRDQTERLRKLINSQADNLKTLKREVFNKIMRWMPFSSPILFPSVDRIFQRITSDRILTAATLKAATHVHANAQEPKRSQSHQVQLADMETAAKCLGQLGTIETPKQPVKISGFSSVTEQFRRTQKYTTESIMRSSRRISDDCVSIQSDQITIGSPMEHSSLQVTGEVASTDMVAILRSQQRRDIRRGIQVITDDLKIENDRAAARSQPEL